MGESSEKMPVASAARKTLPWVWPIVIWMLNIAIFVAIYWTLARVPTVAGVLAVIGIVVAILVAIVAGSYVIALRLLRRAHVDINVAIAALARGQMDRAHETFARWCESRNPVVSAIARHNLGWTLLRQGRLEEALAVVENNDWAHERDLKRITLHATSSVDLSLISGLLGKSEDAESWLAKTDQRAAIAANPGLPAMRAFARAVLDCRRERYEEAARLLDEQWAECEAALTGAELRPLRVVRAYAHAALGPRNAGVAEHLLSSARPVYDGEYDFLGVAWPAMQAFLVSHRLVRESARVVTDGTPPVVAEEHVAAGDQASG